MKNIIFQYMIIDEDTDKRGKVPEYPQGTRADLYKRTADLSAMSFMIYADKIGAVHHYSRKKVFTKDINGPTVPLFEILRLVYDPMYDNYDKLLFVDTDIICNTEQNIFDEVKDGIDVTGVFESEIRTNTGGGYNTWDYNEKEYQKIKEKYELNNIPLVPTESKYHPSSITTFNTGMLVWTREARLKARDCFDSWYDYMNTGSQDFWLNNDQPFISGQLMKHGFKVKSIDQKWNDTPTHWEDGRGYDMNFLHYTGGGNKVVMLEDYEKGKFKYLKP